MKVGVEEGNLLLIQNSLCRKKNTKNLYFFVQQQNLFIFLTELKLKKCCNQFFCFAFYV